MDANKSQVIKCVFNFDQNQVPYQISGDAGRIEKLIDSSNPAFCVGSETLPMGKELFSKGELFLLHPLSVTIFIHHSGC